MITTVLKAKAVICEEAKLSMLFSTDRDQHGARWTEEQRGGEARGRYRKGKVKITHSHMSHISTFVFMGP